MASYIGENHDDLICCPKLFLASPAPSGDRPESQIEEKYSYDGTILGTANDTHPSPKQIASTFVQNINMRYNATFLRLRSSDNVPFQFTNTLHEILNIVLNAPNLVKIEISVWIADHKDILDCLSENSNLLKNISVDKIEAITKLTLNRECLGQLILQIQRKVKQTAQAKKLTNAIADIRLTFHDFATFHQEDSRIVFADIGIWKDWPMLSYFKRDLEQYPKLSERTFGTSWISHFLKDFLAAKTQACVIYSCEHFLQPPKELLNFLSKPETRITLNFGDIDFPTDRDEQLSLIQSLGATLKTAKQVFESEFHQEEIEDINHVEIAEAIRTVCSEEMVFFDKHPIFPHFKSLILTILAYDFLQDEPQICDANVDFSYYCTPVKFIQNPEVSFKELDCPIFFTSDIQVNDGARKRLILQAEQMRLYMFHQFVSAVSTKYNEQLVDVLRIYAVNFRFKVQSILQEAIKEMLENPVNCALKTVFDNLCQHKSEETRRSILQAFLRQIRGGQ
jgi:hypothetical protein